MAGRRGSHTLEDHDPWILLSVWTPTARPAELTDVIGAADYINHAIPTREELESAFTRLNAAGLLRKRKAGYVPTDLTLELMEKVIENCRRGIRSRLRGLQAMLDCPCCGVRFAKPRRTLTITPDEYDAAVAAYRKRFREA